MSFNYLLFIYKTIILNFRNSQSKHDDLFFWKENCPADVDGHATSLGWQLVFKWKINSFQSVKAGTSSSKGSARLLKTLHTMKFLTGRRNEWGEARNDLSLWRLQLPCKPCFHIFRGGGCMPCRLPEEYHWCSNGDSPTDPRQTSVSLTGRAHTLAPAHTHPGLYFHSLLLSPETYLQRRENEAGQHHDCSPLCECQ